MKESLSLPAPAAPSAGPIALELARRGAKVAAMDEGESEAAETSRLVSEAGGVSASFTCDIAERGQAEQAVAGVLSTFGSIDILVNNAGAAAGGPFLDAPAERIDREVATRLAGHMALCRAVLRHMAPLGYGKIVNVVPEAAAPGIEGAAIDSAIMGGLIGLTRALAREFSPHRVNVNCVCPGPVDSPVYRDFAERDPEGAKARLERIPMKRVARPEEVAAAVAFLASDGAAYVTGITLGVDGGVTRQP